MEDNCTTYYDQKKFTIIAIIRAAAGTISAVCCLFVISLIMLFKKYKFFSQRLILYLAVAAMIHSLSYPLARVNYYTPRPLNSPYCYFGGFFHFYSSWIEVLSLACLTFNIFLNAAFDKWPPEKTRYVYLAVSYLLPLLWCWVPFLNHGFGNGDAWCDIRLVTEHCERFVFGDVVRIVLWYGPLWILMTIMLIATIIVAIQIYRRSQVWYGPFDPNKETKDWILQKELRPLIWYPIVYFLLTMFALVNRLDVIIQPQKPIFTFWYLHVFTSPFRGAFIAVVYSLDQETRKRLKYSHLKAACFHLFHKDDIEEYKPLTGDITDSLRPGYRTVSPI